MLFSGAGYILADGFGTLVEEPIIDPDGLACHASSKVRKLAERVVKNVEEIVEQLLSVKEKIDINYYKSVEYNDMNRPNNSIGFMNEREEQLVMADLDGCEFWDEESRREAFARYACVLDFDISDELRTRIRGLRTDISQLTDARQAALQRNVPQAEEKRRLALLRSLQRMFRCNPTAARNFLDAIWDAEPSEVVNVVNQCWADGLLSEWVKSMDVWRLLNENGLYAPSHQNWSKACNIKCKSK
ncbi:MAG: hypothetical protein MJZ67_02620 [Bacteroidales bacterium]|nr:hypothetical protein [Bacteroidales bacterium]